MPACCATTACTTSPAAALALRAASTRRLPLLAVSISWSTRNVESTVLLRRLPEPTPACGLMFSTPRLSTGLGRCDAICTSAWLASTPRRAAMMVRLQRNASWRAWPRVSVAPAGGGAHGPLAGAAWVESAAFAEACGSVGRSAARLATAANTSREPAAIRDKAKGTVSQARFEDGLRLNDRARPTVHSQRKKSSCATVRDAVARHGCLGAPSPAVLMLSTPPGHDLPPAFKPNRFTNGFHSPDKSLYVRENPDHSPQTTNGTAVADRAVRLS
ncbi:exported hypothetical protein [Cupriavidus taiwanensis]|nr:exported hypothetical protein [Cupriavidus taiwanensis]